jgi:gliding motility-associated-like protein
MKHLSAFPITVSLLILLGNYTAYAQFSINITVNSGTATTTCTDLLSPPDPQWAININNEGWVVYPMSGSCYKNFPNLQFSKTFQCITETPATIPVCFRAFEDDATFLDPCTAVTSCLAEVCVDVPVPKLGSHDFTIQLPANLPSAGSANLTIQALGFPSGINDAFCDALDIGVLPMGVKIGNADTSAFNNYCASNAGEPDPGNFGLPWVNNVGVWFKFSTGSHPGSRITIRAKNDPSSLGDPVNLQVGIFTTNNNTCTGNPSFVAQNHNPADWDEEVVLNCPLPNRTYFILVDAVSDTPDQKLGWFGIEVEHDDAQRAAEYRCQAESLGAVPVGGAVSTNGKRTNHCSNNTNSATATAFSVQKSVWFSFQAPVTGHVQVEAVSDPTNDPIGIQMAAYRSSNNSCGGVFTEVYSQYTAANLDESFELHCLDPGKTYFIMIDGATGNLASGNFTLKISDAGDETPVTNIAPILCAGESFKVGTSVYTVNGMYADTIQLPGGCDSIVNTTLTVLTPLQVNFQLITQGVGLGNTSGKAQVSPTGGAGGYTYRWSDNQVTALATNLVGGDHYCVTITDTNGCHQDTCFEMPYYIHFVPSVLADTLNCFGDQNGRFRFTAIGGFPPYQYSWKNSENSLNGSGQIALDGDFIQIEALIAGTYTLTLSDIVFDTTLQVEIRQPSLITATASVVNASCYNACDGALTANISGGISPYQVQWSNGANTTNAIGLCSDDYRLTITDAKGCTRDFSYSIEQPEEFIAIASEAQEVSCYQGQDGKAGVTTNGSPVSYLWSNNSTTASPSGLAGGIYSVTVTNTDGCTATTSVNIHTPPAPVTASIAIDGEIRCKNDQNGSLKATTSGPGNLFSYNWSNGAEGPFAANLAAGSYAVTVENEKGCAAEATFTLTEPDEIKVDFATNKLTCADEPDAGKVTISQVTGGVEPFTFSNNGLLYSPATEITGFTAGQHSFFIQDRGGCVREFTATIEGPKELMLELEDDKTIDLGESVELRPFINQSIGLNYQWSPAEFLSCADCEQPVAKPLQSEVFSLIVTDEFGCTATADIHLQVIKRRKVYFPNVFSPNGDGINDDFAPFGGNDVNLIKTFKIFDRQGNMVFESQNFNPEDYNHAWNGQHRGKNLLPGVFVWFAEIEFIDGEIALYRGDVTLVR